MAKGAACLVPAAAREGGRDARRVDGRGEEVCERELQQADADDDEGAEGDWECAVCVGSDG